MSEREYTDFERYALDEQHVLWWGDVPASLMLDEQGFEEMWALHPTKYHKIQMHGRKVETPRWQQAYGRDYHYTGRVNQALPVPPIMEPYLQWCQEQIDPQLNGILLNWYDAALGHYIGKHRDSTKHMIVGVPIVTMSFGEERIFRLRPWKQSGFVDFPAPHGRVFIMPYETNLAWTHEVPHSKRYQSRRISLTFRGFEGSSDAS